jgi:phosphohistidine swiveling domain-containing protein
VPDTLAAERFVERLGEAEPEVARQGGKGASLSRLVRLGHRVPPGFAVTADAFLAALGHLGVGDELDHIRSWLGGDEDDESPPPADGVRDALLHGPLPPAVESAVLEAVDELRLWEANPDGLIVRSSATVEDSSALSFAGIFESFPITEPGQLLPALRDVWASVFSPRALSYARERGLREIPTMAVVVQRFLEAERSGVMFTRFAGPLGDRILVEHVEGTCEKLVKGEVTPDRLWIDPVDGVAEDLEGLLAAEHARELTRLAADLEREFGGPQDVEWCVYDGAVHLVQSRPITTAGVVAVPEEAAVHGHEPVLTGVAASTGVGAGPVHLVFNIDQALELERGSVLVTPMTNPDMVVAMRNSAGIVTDVGGMICHAAIVSRELGLPCVVGTETATRTLDAGEAVTVDGSGGAVYRGLLTIERPAESLRPAEWSDLWAVWDEATADRPDLVPIVSSIDALPDMPARFDTVVLVPDVDLRADGDGLWRDLEAMPQADREAELNSYVSDAVHAAGERVVKQLYLLPIGGLPEGELRLAAARADTSMRAVHVAIHDGEPPVALTQAHEWPPGRVAVPLAAAASVLGARAGTDPASTLGPPEESLEAALDTIKFFGHRPGSKTLAMPDPDRRKSWWDELWEYGRMHKEARTAQITGTFEWLEIRPELVISPLLKSLVQPGFEVIPRSLSFAGLRPMYAKWVRGRYHFRSDVFADTWEAIVRLTWDREAMTDLMRRVRASYESLAEVLALFPEDNDALRALTPDEIVALITSWWPRWVEFFALNWFIQAQGDDVAYPFVEETVADSLARVGGSDREFAWPAAQDLIAPTMPVMSGDYMASMGRLREALVAAHLDSKEEALAALDGGQHPAIAAQLEEHLRTWHWMRDRDLYFEPWDTPARVIETALRTEPHAPADYAANLRRNRLALSFHFDLAHATSRAAALNHHARFLHDLNVERENHHVLWLKYSYPLRRVVLEVQRRFVELGSLEPGDVFFVQAPELLDAVRRLPEPMGEALVAKVRNRRIGFLTEARLKPPDADWPEPVDEDDYL